MSERPVVLVVMDGVGVSDSEFGDAVRRTYKPTLGSLWENSPHTEIRTHGLAVRLPTDDDMGNSEIGHNTLGCEQIYSQGAKLVNENIEAGEIFKTETWSGPINNCKDGKMHSLGLLSDGNVHPHISHLKALIKKAREDGVKEVRVHASLDEHGVPETSALAYVGDTEAYMAELSNDSFHAYIASGGGRVAITMDRYEANWAMVEQGWHVHMFGEDREFASAKEAIETYRTESGVVDQDLPGSIIAKNGEPVDMIEDEDSVILFNFRDDRTWETSLTFDGDDSFDKFDHIRMPKVMFAGMLQYDADLNIPHNFLTYPPKIEYTLTEELCRHGIREYAVSKTQKFRHITCFWNGNRSEKLDEKLEGYMEIKSDVIPFEQRPWMESAEIADVLCTAIGSGNYDFLHTNYPNGDMVGHTGDFEATVIGVEPVDLQLARVKKAVDAVNDTLIVTADHGNADGIYKKEKEEDASIKVKTSRALDKVPFIIYSADVELRQDEQLGLSNAAATVASLLEVVPNGHWNESIIKR